MRLAYDLGTVRSSCPCASSWMGVAKRNREIHLETSPLCNADTVGGMSLMRKVGRSDGMGVNGAYQALSTGGNEGVRRDKRQDCWWRRNTAWAARSQGPVLLSSKQRASLLTCLVRLAECAHHFLFFLFFLFFHRAKCPAPLRGLTYPGSKMWGCCDPLSWDPVRFASADPISDSIHDLICFAVGSWPRG